MLYIYSMSEKRTGNECIRSVGLLLSNIMKCFYFLLLILPSRKSNHIFSCLKYRCHLCQKTHAWVRMHALDLPRAFAWDNVRNHSFLFCFMLNIMLHRLNGKCMVWKLLRSYIFGLYMIQFLVRLILNSVTS